jgi:hypothetical protein
MCLETHAIYMILGAKSKDLWDSAQGKAGRWFSVDSGNWRAAPSGAAVKT